MGGIVEAYIAPWDSVSGVTVEENQITAITMAAEAKFKKYYFKPGSSSYTSTLNVDNSTGMNYVSTDIVLLFSRMDTTKRVEVAALSVTGLAIIVKDGNVRVVVASLGAKCDVTLTIPGQPGLKSRFGRIRDLGGGRYAFSADEIDSDVLE